jgi:hypothetical protein
MPSTNPRAPGPARWLCGLCLVLVLASVPACDSPAEPGPDRIRVLLLGNSLFAFNVTPWVLQALADSADVPRLELVDRAYAGRSLRDHWQDAEAREILENEGPWDLLILQDGGIVSDTGRAYQTDYVSRFRDATSAVVALVLVWAPRDEPEYFDVLHESAVVVADATGANLIPVGEAWRAALALDPDVGIYHNERYPTVAGAYLNGLVLFHSVFGRSPRGLPAGLRLRHGEDMVLDQGLAALLQEAAEAAWAWKDEG